jgi:hypothetical protein
LQEPAIWGGEIAGFIALFKCAARHVYSVSYIQFYTPEFALLAAIHKYMLQNDVNL